MLVWLAVRYQRKGERLNWFGIEGTRVGVRHDSFATNNRNTCKLTSSVAISCISMGIMASSMATLVRRRFVWTTFSAVVCWKRATAAREAKPRLRLEKSMMMFCLMCTFVRLLRRRENYERSMHAYLCNYTHELNDHKSYKQNRVLCTPFAFDGSRLYASIGDVALILNAFSRMGSRPMMWSRIQ